MNEEDKLPEKVQEAFFEKILSRQENGICADCAGKAPRWASISFGVFICMRCAGPHRKIGPLYTKVKSVKLDVWTRNMAEIMEKIGNVAANEYWEYKMPLGFRKPTVNSSMSELERFVEEKYVKRSFAPHDFVDPVTEYLDAKKNGTQPKSHNKEPKAPALAIQTTPPPKLVAPETKAHPPLKQVIPVKKEQVNLWGEEPGDLIAPTENNQDWGEFVEATNQNPPLTPKVTPSSTIMDMYKKSMDKPKESENQIPNPQAFPVNHSYMNNLGFVGMAAPHLNMGVPGMNMNMGNNSMNMANNMNMRNWNMMSQQQMMYNNAMNAGGMGAGMNMMSGGFNMNNTMGVHPQNNINNTNGLNNSNEKKIKSGDIMNLYNTAKNDTALSGNEMQMNKKAKGQENIMGMYSGNNFNVW